jgi:uncharacterized membrane protein HdeD (DUF308 family)
MKRAFRAIKNFKWGYLLFAILFVGAGLAFLSFPDKALTYVRIGIGVTVIVFCGIYVALTLANRGRGFTYWSRMVMGVLGMVCGGFMIFAREKAFEYLVFVFGLYMIIDASFKLQTSILSKRYKSGMWWVMLAMSAAGIVLGTFLLRTNFDFAEKLESVSRLLGVGMMLDGAMNLLSIAYLYQIEHGTRREIEDQLREEGSLVTVVNADETAQPPMTRARKKALKQERKEQKRAALHGEKTARTLGERPATVEVPATEATATEAPKQAATTPAAPQEGEIVELTDEVPPEKTDAKP